MKNRPGYQILAAHYDHPRVNPGAFALALDQIAQEAHSQELTPSGELPEFLVQLMSNGLVRHEVEVEYEDNTS